MKITSNKWALVGVGALTGAIVVGTTAGVWYAVDGGKVETTANQVTTQDTIAGLNKQIKDLEDLKVQLETAAAADKAEIAKLTQDLADAINNNPNTAAKDLQISELTQDLADANAQVATIVGLQKQIADLTDDNQQKDADIADLNKDLGILTDQVAKFLKEIADKNGIISDKDKIIADKDAIIAGLNKQYYKLDEFNDTADHQQWEDSVVFNFKANVNGLPTDDVKQWTGVVANKNGLFTMKKATGEFKHHTEWDVAGDFTDGFIYQKPGTNDFLAGTKTGLYISENKVVKKIATGDFTHGAMIDYEDATGVEQFAVYHNDGFYKIDIAGNTIGTTPILKTDLKIQAQLIVYDTAGVQHLFVGTDQGGYWIDGDGQGGLKQQKVMDGDIQFITEVPKWEKGVQNKQFDIYIGTTGGLFQTAIPQPGDVPSIDKLIDNIDLTGGFVGFAEATPAKPEGTVYVGTPGDGLKKLYMDKLIDAALKPVHAFDDTYVKGGFMISSETLTLVGTSLGTFTLEEGDVYAKLPGPIVYTTPVHHIY